MLRRPAVYSEAAGPDPFEITRHQRYHGARLVASAAKDVEDCTLLLAMLGLDPAEGLEPGGD